jgi:NADH:ubiquinone oxidoreductase subunit 4 (subunit M)
MPSQLPNTIKDAIAVTQQLGFRYLWIDRYCIDQQNQTHAMQQIEQMGSIYKYSEITIIAACGIDPSYGLPGIGMFISEMQLATGRETFLKTPY